MSAAAHTISILKMGFAEPELLAKYGDYVDLVRRKHCELGPFEDYEYVDEPATRLA